MEEHELRTLALRVRGKLTAVIDEPGQLELITIELDRALTLPAGQAKRALRAVLLSDAGLRRWVRQQREEEEIERMRYELRELSARSLKKEREEELLLRAKPRVEEAGPAAMPRSRFLHAQLPERVDTGSQLSLIVVIAAAPPGGASSSLKPFDIPPEGATVTVIVSAPGLEPRGDMEQDVVVPASGDSEPCRFAFRARAIGLQTVTVDAYRGGTRLGSVRCQVSVEVGAATVEGTARFAELTSMDAVPGEVTLQVSRDADGYSFQLIGESMYLPERGRLAGDPAAVVVQIAAELRAMAARTSPYSTSDDVRRRLVNLGTQLWAAAVPKAVQDQFWEQVDHIRSFTIASDQDVLPWELLYPLNGNNERGFLAEQFPVVRRVYGPRRVLRLPLASAAYVVPPNSPQNALDEIAAVRAELGVGVGDRGIVAALTELDALLHDTPGLLHFACHNTFSDVAGSSIALDGGPWTPSDLATAVQRRSLAGRSPLVFLNACRSAGETAWLSTMVGWAGQFVAAGAGAFIGTLWAVRSSTARRFAEAFYQQLVQDQKPLGEASLQARRAIADEDGDPTWLAYTIYGDPAATVGR